MRGILRLKLNLSVALARNDFDEKSLDYSKIVPVMEDQNDAYPTVCSFMCLSICTRRWQIKISPKEHS